ncbi:MAG: hypothetical protein ABII97_03305 [Patescibacteria group bacterium]
MEKGILKLSQKEAREVISKCKKCSCWPGVKKHLGMNPALTLQVGHCSKYGEVHFLDYSGYNVYVDSRKCD